MIATVDGQILGREEASVSPLTAWYFVTLAAGLVGMSFIDRGILSVVAQPLIRDLGLQDQQLGLLMGTAFALVYALVGLPAAQILDRGARVKLMGLGAVVWGMASLASGFASSFAALAVCRGLLAAGEAVLTPAVVSLIPDLFPRERRALPMAIYFAMPTIGLSMTYMVGAGALDLGAILSPVTGLAPWRSCLMIVALPPILLGTLMALSVREPTRGDDAHAVTAVLALKPALAYFWRERRFYAGFSVGMALISAAWIGATAWLPTGLVRAYGLAPAKAAYLLGVISLPTAVAGSLAWPALASWIERRGSFGARGSLMVGLAATAALVGLALFLHRASLSLVCFGTLSFAIAGLPPTGSLLLQSFTPPRLRARATAAYVFLISVVATAFGASVVPLLAGAVFPGRKEAMLCAIGSAIVVLGAGSAISFLAAAKPAKRAIERELGLDR